MKQIDEINKEQFVIALAKLYSGTCPGDDMWSELDYEAVEAALGHPVERLPVYVLCSGLDEPIPVSQADRRFMVKE